MTTMLAPKTTDPTHNRVLALGRDLFERIGRGPSPWQRAWWDDRLMALTMDDPMVKIQLFRFIDALPALRSSDSVRRHLAEYLGEAGDRVPWWMDLAVKLAPEGTVRSAALARGAFFGAEHMARRFIAGSNPGEALGTVLALRAKGLGFTADLLGEAVISESEAETYQGICLDLLKGLAPTLAEVPEVPNLDLGNFGQVPRVNLSLKLTSLTAHFDPIHAEATTVRVLDRLRPILRTARDLGAFVNIDMEQYAFKDLTYAIFRQVMSEPEFHDWTDVGIVCQAYLKEAEADLHSLAKYSRERGTPITIRLVKGAYWDYEVIHARQSGWPVPVYTEKWRSDASYERCSKYLVENSDWLHPAFASHNIRSLAHAMAYAEEQGVDPHAYEVQVLHGMGEPIARAVAAMGRRVRVYTPYGAMLPGMAYLVRRLLENTSNESFLKASFNDKVAIDQLLRDPEETGIMLGLKRKPAQTEAKPAPTPFRNEPLTDFTRPEPRVNIRLAITQVRSQLGRTYPLIINGVETTTQATLESIDPGDRSIVVGRTARATAEHASSAVQHARQAQPTWGSTPAVERASVLQKAAEILRRRKFELAAWEVVECAKPWREADADVAEAIDFCEFYAREMIRLDEPSHRDVPGETNRMEHLPRGIVVVIPPWNFPLAIPMGMTVAALVAGNAVILKPAEQSPVIGWHLVQVLYEAGLPREILSYLPGVGEEVGEALVASPGVDLIAFTGSRAVGLEINRRAAEHQPGQDHVKRVIAEMGGKNALIIDADADLDEAVVGTIQSAFSYSGQKCSACSRVIVLDEVYDAFVGRLAEAALAIQVGPADDPETTVGPVIDDEARDRIARFATIAKAEGRVIAELNAGPLILKGSYISPLIVADVNPSSVIAQEEVFGPILAVIRAKDLDDALEIANGTAYALTGGLYSRSPVHIDRVKRELRVGNIYINRPITGALVDRQPFGGFKLSGIGTKAGGSDYLREFMLSRTVTENTLRRGFAPDSE